MSKDIKKESKLEITNALGYSNIPGILHEGSIVPLPRNMLGDASYLLGINIVNRPNVNIVERFNVISAMLNNIMEAISYNIMHQVPEHTSEIEKSTERIRQQLDEYMANNIQILEQNRQNIRIDLKDRDNGIENKIDLIFSNQQRLIHQLNEQKDLILQLEKNKEVSELKNLKEEILKEQRELKNYLKKQFEG